jgi:hypothetical protein
MGLSLVDAYGLPIGRSQNNMWFQTLGNISLRPGGDTQASRAVVGLQYLLGPASESPPMQQSSLARCFEQMKDNIFSKKASKWKPKSALGVRKMFKAMQHV